MRSQTLQLRVPILMGNAIWFLILAGLSIILVVYVFWRKKDLKLLALFFGLGAIAGYLENVICIWFQSYEYYPKILEDPYYDLILGTYLSQVYYVSSVALFIAAFNLRYRWILAFIAMFVGIEYLFLALGVYKLNWWHPGYTAVGLLIYFWISKRWHTVLLQNSSRFIRWFTLFCLNYIIYGDLIAIPLFSNHYHFAVAWFNNPTRATVTVIIIFMLIRGAIFALVCFYKLHWSIMVLVPILMWVFYKHLIHLHMFTYKHFWDLLLFALSDIVILICCYFFNRILTKHPTYELHP
ncbi:hypothetical protein ASG89_23285 [Paenibacillus sp. Soil766]|uniref:hypothetical protein n=1 Tax=Paenibacillus sp. Soil766 TaxID=1736404 RepID=UPI0007111990|nr:hypothetical protein [Paenibacillus sp. Soil766]KRF03368.1 hypothetical protein ASG89_23285 [Paenibacillus sp. Soil766]